MHTKSTEDTPNKFIEKDINTKYVVRMINDE